MMVNGGDDFYFERNESGSMTTFRPKIGQEASAGLMAKFP